MTSIDTTDGCITGIQFIEYKYNNQVAKLPTNQGALFSSNVGLHITPD